MRKLQHRLPDAFRNWGDFIGELTSEWIKIRYDYDKRIEFTKEKVEKLYNNLMDKNGGILSIIEQQKKW